MAWDGLCLIFDVDLRLDLLMLRLLTERHLLVETMFGLTKGRGPVLGVKS